MRLYLSAILSAVLFFSVSCEKTETKTDADDRKFISMKLDNKIYLSENPKATAYLPKLDDSNPDNDYPVMEITGTTYTGDYITFKLAVPELPFHTGAYYSSETGNSMNIYLPSSNGETLNTGTSAGFVINITRINSQFVEGTFSGSLQDVSGSSSSRVVKDGTFRAVLKYQEAQ
ncbi:hypothetical protein SAMN05444266_101867 [Chitinophaga jiangningensis]|uniref:Uncharacterized protein n=1 Tax=Chitinophaga jiangningensis TaxID=1419482 RepID=A0A1M6X2M9_9BACT|nr:hypothetical protein [Chitinophaga jiangningensis]SHL00186.1 hypothetical protein SAMN05444266_101867 [Chitinophaga jiangningensis]